MAKYGNYYGNLGQKYTGFSDETPDAKPLPLGAVSQATPYGGSYSGSIAVGKPRVNSFAESSGGVGGVGRDVLASQKGVRAAQQDYDKLKTQEGFTQAEIPIAGAAERNAAAAKRNSLAALLDQYNSQLSGTLRSARFGDPQTTGYEGGTATDIPRAQGFHPIGINDFDGVQDQTRSQLLSAVKSLTPEELAAASPEFRIWAQEFQKFGVSQDPNDYGTSGLSNYLKKLSQAGVVNPAYVDQLGTSYNGSAIINDGSRVGSSFNWGHIDQDLANGFLPNSGLNFDEGRLANGQSPFPVAPSISTQAMYNPFTNSPVETSKNGVNNVYIDRTSQNAVSPGFQWGQGAFSTPFAPYYSTGYGGRFKAAPNGNGPQQWAARGADFATKELQDYVPEKNVESTTKRVIGNLYDAQPQALAQGQRETFTRNNQIDAPKLQEVKTSVPKTNLAAKPSIYGESTVDLGNIGAGFESYRIMSANPGQIPVADKLNYFGVLNQGNGLVWDARNPGEIDPKRGQYLTTQSGIGLNPYVIKSNGTNETLDTIAANNLRFAYEGYR